MNILLLGSGGREHTLAWKIAGSPLVTKLWCAPGNAGIARDAECVALDIADHAAVIAFCKTNKVDLVVVGPEAPLAAGMVDDLAAAGIKHVPGFGHRFHPVDPRAPRLLEVVEAAAATGRVSGRFASIGRTVEQVLGEGRRRPIPMNIDGATAVVYAELGFPPPLCRGLFVLSRSVGALAHAWEQMQQPQRNKGPIPREFLWTYRGPELRHLAEEPGDTKNPNP